jgi:hypothetical protein
VAGECARISYFASKGKLANALIDSARRTAGLVLTHE